MNLLKKVLWLLIISIITLNATEQTQLCQAFADGIQTRTNSSKIKFINNSYLFNNPNSSLNGFKVINQNSNLSCRDVNGTTDEVCQSSNALGMSVPLISLQTPEAFTFTEAVNNATHIKMKKLMVKKNKNLNLTASSAIYLERLEVAKNSTVTITAPKVVIGHLSSFQKSNIKIIADTIDIKIIKLENKADLIIESFNEDAEVKMKVDKLKLKKASLLLNNGLYHIKRVELKNRSSLKVGDSVQIVNRRTVVLNHSRINASKDSEICDDEHNPNALFIYSNDLVRVENHSKIVAMIYNDRRVEFTKHAGLKGAVSAKNRAIFKNHSKVCYSKCNLTSTNTDLTPPVITLNGNTSISITQDNIYNELGATAVDNVDGNIEVSMSGNVDTSIVGTYTIVYTAKDNANNEASLSREVIVTKKDVEYGVNIGILLGNTARFYRQASFSVSLKSQPKTNVTIPLSSSDVNEGEIVGVKKLVFTPENWDETQSVFITGKNKNVGEGEQNYKVILGKIISEDANYNDLDPNDVPLKFKILSITAPKDKYDFVPTSRKVICIKVNTAIFKQNLRYKIVDAPIGMKMEEDSTTIPCVEWKAPISESGTTHNVTLEVRDGGGSTKKEISFEIHVANTIPLQSEIDGDSVTITEPNSNLKGLRVTRLEPNINLEDIKFRKVVDPYLEPHGRNKISDIFIEEKLIKGKIKVTIPQVKRDDIDSLSSVSLYAQTGEYGYQGFGGSISNLLEEGRVELRGVFGVGFGHHFIGLNNEHFGKRRAKKLNN